MGTPLIDFAPKAFSTIQKCQDILAEFVVPHSDISERECINRLLGVLDDQTLVVEMRVIAASTERQPIGIKDRHDKDIHAGDPLLLEYGGVTLKGVAKQDTYGDWEIYKNEKNHVSIEDNRMQISIIN